MPANPVIGLDVDLKVQKALDELKRLSPGADKEARAITQALGRSLKESEKNLKKLGDTAESGGGKALKAFGPLGGVLGKISPAAGQAASSIAGMTSALEGFEAVGAGPLVAALAAALGGAALLYEGYTADTREAAAVTAELAQASSDLQPAMKSARLAEIDLAVATGKITEEAGRLQRDGIAALDAFASATVKARDRIAALHAEEGSFQRTLGDFGDAARAVVGDWNPTVRVIDAFTTSSAEAAAETTALMGTIQTAHDVIKGSTKAHEEAAAATERHKAATAALTDAYREAEAEYGRESSAMLAGLAAKRTASRDLAGMLSDAASKRLDDIGKVRAAEDEAAAHAAELAGRAGQTDAQIAASVAAVRAGYEVEVTRIYEAEVAKREQADADAAAKSAQAAAAHRDAWLGASSSIIGSVESIAQSTARTYDTTTAAGREAAMRSWRAQHAVAIGTATALAAVAEAQAVASAPFPYNLPAIAEATIAGGASIAAAAAAQPPAFHAGGQMAPDEARMGSVKVQPGEGIGVISKQGMSAANAGMSAAPISVVIEQRLRHQVMDRVMTETLQRGDRFARALGEQRTVPFGARSDTWRR